MDLSGFKDIHLGKRAFLLACGPSLNDLDLSLLEGELVYGVSLAYKSDKVAIDYHFMGDKNIASQFYKEILPLTNTWFVSKSIYDFYLKNKPNTYYFTGPARHKKKFKTDLSDGKVYGGGTSSFLAMQFAYFMGIQELYTIGLDHWKTYRKGLNVTDTGIKNPSGSPLVISNEDDIHHFTPDFYKKGVKFYTPTFSKVEASYWAARNAYEADGRILLNASADTALSEDIIPRVNFYELFD